MKARGQFLESFLRLFISFMSLDSETLAGLRLIKKGRPSS